MADDSDVDNELEKESVKKGRRAKAAIQNKKEVTCEDGNSQDSFEGKECNGFPGRRIADWNEINVPHGVSFGRRAQTNLQNICDLSQKQESDEELEIPIIPDVCSAEESVVDSKSAVPPKFFQLSGLYIESCLLHMLNIDLLTMLQLSVSPFFIVLCSHV
ncbi:unnamed protein product [Heterobilharzia americana]|nr:unnamed protein product [Heterobilharzia americana]